MKTQLLAFCLVVQIFSSEVFSQTNVSGAYFSNETWTQAGSPYMVVGDVQIPIDYSLTIEPGVKVEYTGPFEILVKGGIVANGMVSDSISFLCSQGISTGVTMIRFVDVDFSNSQLSYSNFNTSEKAISIQGTCSNTLSVFSTSFSSSEIINEGLDVNILLKNTHLENLHVENNYYSENSTITIDSSNINSSNFDSKTDRINFPCMIVKNSQVNNSSFVVGYSDCYTAEMELINLNCNNCTFSTIYGKLKINESKIINSSFNNHYTTQQCQVFFDINRSFLVNTSIESSVTNQSNQWWSTINIDQCIIQKSASSILGYQVGDISNSIIIGTYNSTGINILRGSFNNVTIVNNDVGILREVDNLAFSVTNSNIFYNSTYNLQNNSSEIISAINNYWGLTDINEIGELIYDYYDDINLGQVDITNYSIIPNTDCPISPPRNIVATEVSGGYELSWSANPESNLAGYKLYYGSFDGFTFQNSIDVGLDTTYTIPVGFLYDTIAITAYNSESNNIDDMIEGDESWYSLISDFLTTTPINSKKSIPGCIVAPNPASNIITIQAIDITNNIKQVDIININGILLYTMKMDTESIKNIDISEYPCGIYFIKTILENSREIQKIIKK